MEDTDSMAIVATPRGGLIECPGGSDRKHGKPAIRTLSWAQVDAIAKRFEALNPYDRAAIPGSVLKIEDDNFEPEDETAAAAVVSRHFREALHVISARPPRRTGFAARGCQQQGRPLLRARVRAFAQSDRPRQRRSRLDRASVAVERAPIAGAADEIAAVCEPRCRGAHDRQQSGRYVKPLRALNDSKPYAKQIKPFNFILSCHVRKLGHPFDVDPERFHLIAPYETDPQKWEAMRWIDQYSKPCQALPDQHDSPAWVTDDGASEELWRRTEGV